MTITEIAIKRPTLVVVVFSFLAVLGIFGFSQLNYELMPKMTPPILTIVTIYPGGSPNEVETSITKVIEDAVSGLDKIASIRAYSQEGQSMVIVELDQSANIDFAVQDAQRKVNAAVLLLPKDARTPVVSKIAFDELPVLRMSVYSKMPSKEFYQFVLDKVQPRLSKIAGVGQVILLGGEEREILVSLDVQKLRSYGLSLNQVVQGIKASNMEFPTGNIKASEDEYVVRLAGKLKSIEELKQLIIARSKQGGEIRMKDIAEIEDGIMEISNINRLNGINSIGILIQKQSDANTVDISQKASRELKNMEKEYADIDLKFAIAQDASIFTLASANAVKEDLAIAILLVALVMLLFLHSIRNSLIVLVAIPSSLVSTFFLMWAFDFSLNMMTLLAMSLVIGILVDDSIVVLENIYRHLEKGDDQRTAALKGRNEIGFAALSITMVDVVVFVPLALITGTIGNFVRQYSLVVVFSTLMSLFVSFTITPMLASRFTKLEHLTKKSIMGRFGIWIESYFTKLSGYYKRLLIWSLANKGKVVVMAIILLLSSFLLLKYGFIGSEFMPQIDRGEFSISLELDPGSSIENTNLVSLQVEEILRSFPEVKTVLANVGASSEGIIGQYSSYVTSFNVALVDKHQRSKPSDQIGQEIKKKIQKIPGVKVRVSPISIMGFANRPPIQMLINGTTFEDVSKAAIIIEGIVKTVEGTTDIRLSSQEGNPELKVEIDRNKLSAFGLTINDVGQSLNIALSGNDDSKYRDGINDYDILIRLDEFDRTKVSDVGSLTLMNNKGQQIELKQFASIYQTTGPTRLERENRMCAITVTSQVYGSTSGTVAQKIRDKMQNVKLPRGVTYSFTGEQKMMKDSFISLAVALLAAILFVYMIMIALYDSYLYPFVVLFSIPVAMIGALYALGLSGKSISIYSILGIIMLVGLVGKNAILLVDRANQMRREKGMTTFDAIIEAGQTRLRPILMTTFAMVMGMSPIAFSTSAGSEAKSGLGMVLIGGLISSLLLTLVLVPVVFVSFDKWKVRIPLFFKGIFRKSKEEIVNL